MNSNNCIIIAHRGESYDSPENTLASINLAWERNADAVEIDVQLTIDNKIVVIHDKNTKRITGRNKLVKDQTLSDLEELDAGSFKDKKWCDEKIPVLSEVLKMVPEGKKIIIEIKCGTEIINFLKEEISKSGLNTDQIKIIGFDISVVTKAKQALADHKVLWLNELDYTIIGKVFSPSVDKLIEKVKENNLDGLDLWAGKFITREFVQKIKSNGLLLYVWTVNDPAKAKILQSFGIDGITTDRAGWMKEKIGDS